MLAYCSARKLLASRFLYAQQLRTMPRSGKTRTPAASAAPANLAKPAASAAPAKLAKPAASAASANSAKPAASAAPANLANFVFELHEHEGIPDYPVVKMYTSFNRGLRTIFFGKTGFDWGKDTVVKYGDILNVWVDEGVLSLSFGERTIKLKNRKKMDCINELHKTFKRIIGLVKAEKARRLALWKHKEKLFRRFTRIISGPTRLTLYDLCDKDEIPLNATFDPNTRELQLNTDSSYEGLLIVNTGIAEVCGKLIITITFSDGEHSHIRLSSSSLKEGEIYGKNNDWELFESCDDSDSEDDSDSDYESDDE